MNKESTANMNKNIKNKTVNNFKVINEYIIPTSVSHRVVDKYNFYFDNKGLIKVPKKQNRIDTESIYSDSDVRYMLNKCLKDNNLEKTKKNINNFIKKDNKKSYISSILSKFIDRNDLKHIIEMYIHYDQTNICYFYNKLFAFCPELEFIQHKKVFKFFSAIRDSGNKNVARKMKSVINKNFQEDEDYLDKEILNIVINLENDLLFKFVEEFLESKHLKSLNLHFKDFMKENNINPSKIVLNEDIEEITFDVSFDKREQTVYQEEEFDEEEEKEKEIENKKEEDDNEENQDYDSHSESEEVDYDEEENYDEEYYNDHE